MSLNNTLQSQNEFAEISAFLDDLKVTIVDQSLQTYAHFVQC